MRFATVRGLMPRRRYDVRFDPGSRQFVVELIIEQGGRKPVERYQDWEAADSMRSFANQRLEDTGELLPERR